MRIALLALHLTSVLAWTPLDGLAALFGSSPLHSTAPAGGVALIEGVAHEPCGNRAGACTPAGGCEARFGRCRARVGHYWFAERAPEPTLLRLLPAIAAPYEVQTAQGVMQATPGFWYTSFRLKGDELGSESLPGLRVGAVAATLSATAFCAFLVWVGLSRAPRPTRSAP